MKKDALTKRRKIIRWSFFVIGLIFLALGITLTIKAKNLGISPWDVLHYGLFSKIGLSIGAWSVIVGSFIVLLTSIILRSLPRIGTYLNMLLIGLFIDIFNWALPDLHAMWLEVVVFGIGLVIMSCGIGIYVAPRLGAGPRDSLMLAVQQLTGWKVQWVRNGIEVLVLVIGWLLGGPVGIGTVIVALGLGTTLSYTMPHAESLMNYVINRGEQYEDINQGTLRSYHHDRACEKVR